jgi:hypothetical protein
VKRLRRATLLEVADAAPPVLSGDANGVPETLGRRPKQAGLWFRAASIADPKDPTSGGGSSYRLGVDRDSSKDLKSLVEFRLQLTDDLVDFSERLFLLKLTGDR